MFGERTCRALLLAMGLGAASASAQDKPYEPTSMRFTEGGVSLAEALQVTLANDPQIKLQAANVTFREGAFRSSRGAFDFAVAGDFFGEYREQELRDSRKEKEDENRQKLRDLVTEGSKFEEDARRLQASLRTALASPVGQEQVTDPVVQAQMVLLRTLISEQTNPEARDELLRLRRQILEETLAPIQTELDRGIENLEKARDQLAKMGDVPEAETFKRVSFALNLNKRFRMGFFVNPFADARLDGTNFKDKLIDAEFGGKGIEDLYTFRAGLGLTIPLLRGLGFGSLAAAEKSAVSEVQAAQLTVKHQNSVSALRTARAYWDLRAAQDALEVANRSAGLQDRIVELTQRLINGGEMPAADLARSQASQLRAKARVQDSERRVHEARVALALAMGITVTEDAATLPMARDPFPGPPEGTLPNDAEAAALANGAPARREDLKASMLREQAAQQLVRGARNDLRPKVDLTGRGWYTSLGEINISDAYDRWIGPSFSGQLTFDVPIGNNVFRGRLLQREADYRTRRITSADLDRQIKLNVIRTAGALREAATRVELAQQAVGFSKKTIESEIEKFQAGDATLIDAILTEDQQTDALLTLVSAQQEYANLLAQLRFESGSLVASDGTSVKPEALISVPKGANP
jgi:outer membrane protein TolC